MDAFATYDPASSDLEDPVKFWQEVDDILQLDGLDVGGSSDDAPLHVDATLLQSRMTSFLALCGVCYGQSARLWEGGLGVLLTSTPPDLHLDHH